MNPTQVYRGYRLHLARADELSLLRNVERAAAQSFRSVGLAYLATWEPMPLAGLQAYQREERLWSVTDGSDQPVGFAALRIIDGCAHLHELNIHPVHGRQGLGRWVVHHICDWASAQGYPAVTLSTFRTVPWNAPFYARLGFRILSNDELSPGLQTLRVEEARYGLPIAQRVCMRRDLVQPPSEQ